MAETVTVVCGFSVMSYPRYTNCRTWWRSLPEARKFGGCYVFGIQSYAQLEDIYGEKAAATLFDVMNTRAFSVPRAIRLQSSLPVRLVRKST